MEPIVKKDVEEIIDNNSALMDQLEGKSFMITGSTGMIGRYAVSMLAESAQRKKGPSLVIAHARNQAKAEEMFADYLDMENFRLLIGDINNLSDVNDDVDYILHAASPTQPQDFLERPVDIIDANVFATKNLLEIAKRKLAKFCLLSTIEVYGRVVADSYPVYVSEKDFGALDSLDLRSAYPESKRLAENLCVAYEKQYEVASTIIRLAPVITPIIDSRDMRVYAQFINNVAEGKDFTIYSDAAPKERSYTYIADAISGIFTALADSPNGGCGVFNLANNDNIISIQSLAEKVIAIGNPEVKLTIVNRDNDSNTSTATGQVLLDSQKLKQLGWSPRYSLDDSIKNTFRYTSSRR